MNKSLTALALFTCISLSLAAQEAPKQRSFTVNKGLTVNMENSALQLNPSLATRKLPKPNAGADKEVIEQVKAGLLRYREQRQGIQPGQQRMAVADSLVMLRNFIGNTFNGYVPNDNDLAISNGDVVCSVSNTTIHSKNQSTGTVYGSFALHNITSGLGLQQEEFDPKILYDPQADRFIFVCLNGFTDSTSNVILGFSEDSTSYGNWNFYSLPGNPLNNSLWTDFPMIAVNDNYLFITVNLLYNDSTWQAGFNESIVWQINKSEGYSGATLNPLLHYDFLHNGEPVRNLCPVKGGSGNYGPDFYLLSNRNFAASNDTVFLVTIPPGSSPVPSLQPVVASTGYHMPADADQPFTDKLAVNDARFLGAFFENGVIQAVANTLDTVSGYDGIYHLRMDDLTGVPNAQSGIYTAAPYDLGYPNIAYAGTGPFSNAAIISLLKTSPTVYPGCGAVYFDNNGDYSAIKSVKEGQGYTNMLAGIERWGDYTGCQTRYNTPGTVWMNGSYSVVNHQTRTWIAELVPFGISSVTEPQEAESEVEIYPNPVADQMSVSFELKYDGTVSMELFDMTGKKVSTLYKGHISAGPNTFSFSATPLPSGTYILRVMDGESKEIGNLRFVKNR